MIVCETKDLSVYITPLYLTSFSMLFLVIWMNDSFSKSYYQGNQWSMILKSPITYLEIIIQSFIIYVPRYIHKNLQDIVWHPEFTKIKGA